MKRGPRHQWSGVAVVSGRDRTNPRRFNNAAFWGLYAITFLVGPLLPDVVNGVIVLLILVTPQRAGAHPSGAAEARS